MTEEDDSKVEAAEIKSLRRFCEHNKQAARQRKIEDRKVLKGLKKKHK